MNNEIKEILNEIGYYQHIHENLTLSHKELDILVDYINNLQTIEQQYSAILSENAELENKIINLQEGNNNLKEDFKRHIDRINELTERSDNLQEKCENYRKLKERYQIEKELYKQRIEKAIEYIKKEEKANPDSNRKDVGLILMNYKRVLNILQGSDKE